MHCALQFEDPDRTALVLAHLEALSPADKAAALSPAWFRDVWERHCDAHSGTPSPPASWLAWATRLRNSGPWPSALEEADNGVVAWETPGSADEALADLLDTIDPDSNTAEMLREALPFLLQADDMEQPIARTAAILLTHLLLAERLSAADVRALCPLLQSQLASSPPASRYAQLVSELGEGAERIVSANWSAASLDLVDTLIAYPCPDEQARLRFGALVLSRLQAFAHRLQPNERAFAQQLSEELRLDIPWPVGSGSEPEQQVLPPSTGWPTVLLYSLQERVTGRVKQFLERRYEGIRVHISGDKVGTARLKHQIQESSLVVVATRHAKHAATDFIERERPATARLIYPSGGGAASMIDAIVHALS
jgi:hypothetical protein